MAKVTKPIALDETLQRVAKALEGQRVIKNVDGEGPDANGRVNLKAVKKVNGRTPDTSGNVNVEIPDVVRRDSTQSVNLLDGTAVSISGTRNIAIGDGIEINGFHSVGIGSSVRINGTSAFVWNGRGDEYYSIEARDHGDGTFTINPAGGVDGVFIGDTPLSKLGLGGGSTRDFVFKSFDGIALDMTLPPEGFIIPSEYTGLDTDIEFKSINEDFKDSCHYSDVNGTHYINKIVFDMCYVPWEDMYRSERYYFIIHGYNYDGRVFSRLIAGWDLNGISSNGGYMEVPTYDPNGDYLYGPVSIKGYDYGYDSIGEGSLTAYQNLAWNHDIKLVKSNGVGDPNMLEIGKLNICKPVIDPYNPEVMISIPKSTNKLMSREAWLVLDLSNLDYLDGMGSWEQNIINDSVFRITWQDGVYGTKYMRYLSENYDDNIWFESSDGFEKESLANIAAYMGRTQVYHLIEIAPNMWIVDTKRLPKYIGLPAGFGSSSGSSGSYDSNYWSY